MDKVLIIAEAGVNYNGSLELAMRMVDAAKQAGADIVKFQTAQPEEVISRHAKKAAYQEAATGAGGGQLEMVRGLLLKQEEFAPLKRYCEGCGIGFLSTPFDIGSVQFLDRLGCSMWKVPSGEITDYPYLVAVARTGKPVILSTGMSSMDEVDAAVALLRAQGAGEVSLLHCNTQYPTPFEDVNLRAMLAMRERFHTTVGYSDHTMGIEVAVAAAAMGARIIEKHFTLDRGMEGPDQKASLETGELGAMVAAIRHIEQALGDGIKRPTASERGNIAAARKSIVARRGIKEGEALSEENITTKRPGDGVPAMQWPQVLGTRAVRGFQEDELITVQGHKGVPAAGSGAG